MRRIPRLLQLISAAWIALLLGASLLWPMTYGYDEPQHIDLAYQYSAHPFTFYGPGGLQPSAASQGFQRDLPGYPPQRPLADVAVPARGHRPTLNALGGTRRVTGAQPNQMVQHPPLYYWLGAVVLRLPGVSHLAWDQQVWLLRLLSVLLLAPLPLLCWATARRLAEPAADRVALLAAVVPLTAPGLVRDVSAVTNDTLLILSTSVLLYLLARVLTGDLTRRTAGAVAGALAVALLSKGFALVLPLIVLLAYAAGARQRRDELRVRLTALGIAAIGAVVGGLWWLRNLVDYGSVQINGFGDYQTVLFGPPDHHGSLATFIPGFVSQFVQRIWGGIGLPTPPTIGALAGYGWLVVTAIGLVLALLVAGGAQARARAAVFGVAVVVTFVAIAASEFGTYHKWSATIRGAQGRYLYHLVVVLSVLAAVGWARVLRERYLSPLIAIVLALGLLTQIAAWVAVVRQWYEAKTGAHAGIGHAVSAVLRWSPVPAPLTVLLIAVLPTAAGGWALVEAVRGTRTAARHAAPVSSA